MTRGEVEVIIRRAKHYVGTDYEFLPSYEELVEAAVAMLPVAIEAADKGPGRLTDDGWRMTSSEERALREHVEECMSRSCPFACEGIVSLWKIAALFNRIDRLEEAKGES